MLTKKQRLSTTYEFNKTRRLGKKISTLLFDVFYLNVNNYDGPSRIGVVVTNRYSKVAPTRNRVKRVFREVIRLNLKKFKDGFWVVVHPKKAAEKEGYEKVNAQFIKTLSKAPFAN